MIENTPASVTAQPPASTRLIVVLTLCLVLQIGLTAFLWATSRNYQPAPAIEKLVKTSIGGSDQIAIDERSDDGRLSHLVISRNSRIWFLPAYHSFPVAESTIENLMGAIKGLRRGIPVTVTSDGIKRFKVADEDFKHKISFLSGAKTNAAVYFGSKPSANTVYVRVRGDSRVYESDFHLDLLPVDPLQWANKNIMHLDPQSVVSIKFPNATIADKVIRNETKTCLVDGNQVHPLNTTTSKAVKGMVTHVNFDRVLGTDNQPQYHLQSPEVTVSATLKDGSTVNFSFGKLSDRDYVVKASNCRFYFEVGDWQVKELQNQTPESILALEALNEKKELELKK